MSYQAKTWKDTVAEYPTRRILTNVSDNTETIVTVERSVGTISQQGDKFNAETMNNLEDRIDNAFTEVSSELAQITVDFEVGEWVSSSASPDYPYQQTITVPTLISGADYRGAIVPHDNSAFLDEDEQSVYVNLLRNGTSITAYASAEPTHTITMILGRL